MQVREALERLDEIHDHLTKAEVYPGFRVPGVALAGVVGLVAAAAQPLVAPPDPAGFVGYWVAVAAACGLLGGGAAVHSYAVREDEFARRRTRRVVAQFFPCLAAGGLLTLAFVRGGPELVRFLPGVWAVVFALGAAFVGLWLAQDLGNAGVLFVSSLVAVAAVAARAGSGRARPGAGRAAARGPARSGAGSCDRRWWRCAGRPGSPGSRRRAASAPAARPPARSGSPRRERGPRHARPGLRRPPPPHR